jgi:hypothetical protein
MRGTWQTTDGGGGSGGGLVLAVIAAAVLIGSGAASAIASALVTILVIMGVVVGLAAIGGVALLVYRARQASSSALPMYQLPAEERPHLESPRKPAIGPGREVHLHLNVTPDQLAAIMQHHLEEDR